MRAFSAIFCLAAFAPATFASVRAETPRSVSATGLYEGIADVHTARGSVVQAPEKYGYKMDCYEREGIDARSAYTQWYFVRNRRTLAECLGLANQLPIKNETYYSRYGNPCSATGIENGVIVRRGPSYPQRNRIRCDNAFEREKYRNPNAPEYRSSAGGPEMIVPAQANRLPEAPAYLASNAASNAGGVYTDAGARALDVSNAQATAQSTSFQSAAQSPNVFHTASPELVNIVRNAAVRNGINPRLLLVVAQVESQFNPNAVSPKGAVGLLQLMPATAAELGVPARELRDPVRNADAGARYLKMLLRRYGNKLAPALAAYNAGPDTVDRAGGNVPNIAETRNYINRVMTAFKPDIYSVYLARE